MLESESHKATSSGPSTTVLLSGFDKAYTLDSDAPFDAHNRLQKAPKRFEMLYQPFVAFTTVR